MKKYLSLLLAIALLVVGSSGVAFAESTAGTSLKLEGKVAPARAMTPEEKAKMDAEKKAMMEKRGDMKNERGEMKADLKAGMEVKKGEWKEEKKEMTEEMRIKARSMVAASLMKRAENLAQISGRLKTRLEKLKTENKIETAAALALVVKADASINVAKTHAAEVKASVEANESLETIKHHADEAREALKQAHQYLWQAIEDIKGRLPKELKAEVKLNSEVKVNTSSGDTR